MEMMVTAGAISRAKLQSNRHHQQTSIQFFTGRMTFLSPNQQCQSTEGEINNITILRYRQQYGICCDSYTAERKSSVLQCNPQTSEFECVCTELTHLLILCVRVLINISLNVAR